MSSTRQIKVVLDTNVALDWLVFADLKLDALRVGLRAARVVVLTHGGAQDELRRVLGYAALKLDESQQTALFCRYETHTQPVELPSGFALNNLLLPTGFPSCKDADDQPFLALAYHAAADAFVSRDNAVLRLRTAARKFGVNIIDVAQLQQLLKSPPDRD